MLKVLKQTQMIFVLTAPCVHSVPLCYPLVTMWSVVFLALTSVALSSADSDTQRLRHDSNLEICILLLWVHWAAARCCHSSVCNRDENLWICMLFVILPDLPLSDKRLFETKRKDQLNALKNLVELNDINQQYKIIDIMLKGLFKVGRLCFPLTSGSRRGLWLSKNTFPGVQISCASSNVKNKDVDISVEHQMFSRQYKHYGFLHLNGNSESSQHIYSLLTPGALIYKSASFFPEDGYLCIRTPHKDTQCKQPSAAEKHCQHFRTTPC